MLYIAAVSLTSLLASAALLLAGQGSRLAVAHLAFAVGILPLIFAAMMHFVPVLTRSRDPHPLIARMPLFAQGLGALVVLAMQGWLPYGIVHAAAALDCFLAASLLVWIVRRARQALGKPHPGWRWYAASLVCLMLALLAILLTSVFPESWRAFRLFHLHINPLGFVGLAALGTLPVLLPTSLGKPDPEAAVWLQKRLPAAFAGALMIALGTALSKPLTWAGSAILVLVFISLLVQWQRRFGVNTLIGQGAAASLLAAGLGAILALAAGLLHGGGILPTDGALVGWVAGFLLPLVTGALSQLLPVWRWPGPDSPQRKALRATLSRLGFSRGLLFLLGSLALFIGYLRVGSLLTAVGMALFVANLAAGMRKTGPTR